ncbi:hypothetical protein KUV28_04605 [Ferrimonas balearica]|nr:hypothetical protein [Ferrimonas balearica]
MPSPITIGDLAQSFMLRQQNTDLKSRMNQLSQELASGRTADVARHLSGSYSYLADVERNLTLIEGYDSAASEAILFTGTMQEVLDRYQTLATDLGSAALTAAGSFLDEAVIGASTRAAEDMESMVNALNTTVAGRAIFSGIDSDTSPLISSEQILDELRTALAGQTDLAGVQGVLDTWFGPGGDFETVAYQGSTTSLRPFLLGEGETVDLDLRADDPGLRELMKHTAMAALASDPALGFDSALQVEMMKAAGEGLSFQQEGIVQLRADLGYAQTRAEEASARVVSERAGYLIAQSELLAVDPYETATQLEDVQFQLEALYALTVKLSRLSLTDYLR